MTSSSSLSDRKAAILHAVVEGFISTSRPVGSGYVARSAALGVSSATVRKEMLALEDAGYLHQPHTSAGRIPTEKGYRLFVDTLMGPTELGRVESQKVSDFFDHTHGEVERVLKETSRLLSSLTDYTAMVVAPQQDTDAVRAFQLVELTPTLALAVVVRATGVIDKHTVEFVEPVSASDVEAAGRIVAEALVDVRADRVRAPSRSGQSDVDRVVADAWDALHGEDDHAGSVFVGGTSKVALAFEAAETVRSVLTLLEKQYVVMTLIRDVLDRGLRVAIGTETGMDNLNDASLVVAEYTYDGVPVGSVGLLGPTHMNYPHALAAVAVVSRELGHRLSDPS